MTITGQLLRIHMDVFQTERNTTKMEWLAPQVDVVHASGAQMGSSMGSDDTAAGS
jgi:hypothetical protein